MAGAIACASVEPVRAINLDIVVPNALTNTEGNFEFPYPFEGYGRPSRYQQVYDSSQFSGIRDGGGIISALRLRLNARCTGYYIINISNLQVNLSTTSKGPDTLSPIFVENIGPDETVVVGPGPFHRDMGICSGPLNGPERFKDFLIFHTPFFFDPSMGNLLVDIRNFSGTRDDGTSDVSFDSHNQTNDSVSSLFVFDVNKPSADWIRTYPYVTQFQIWFEPRPRLQAIITETNLVLQWVNYPGGWTLQQSSVLGSSGTWEPAGGVVITNGTNTVVTLPLDGQASARFFRVVQSSAAFGAAGAPTNPEPIFLPPKDP